MKQAKHRCSKKRGKPNQVNSVIPVYARVSTEDQKLDAQIEALSDVGAERLFSETISGATAKRPELQRMLDQLRDGDVMVVTKYDRLARSLRDVLDIVEGIKERVAGFRSLAEDIDTTTPAGELIFHVFASIAHFERRRIAERTSEDVAVARKQGRIIGRPLPLPYCRPESRSDTNARCGTPTAERDCQFVQG